MSKRPVRCRQIGADDLGRVGDLLAEAFAVRARAQWARVLERMTAHPTPDGYPKYGYVLESEGRLVGMLLVMFTRIEHAGAVFVRGNVSSWHVAPEFRSFAGLLTSHVAKHREATLVNVSPGAHTWPMIEAQGFSRFCQGVHAGIPLLGRSDVRVQLHVVDARTTDFGTLAPPTARLLADHAHYGCLAVRCETAAGSRALVFRRRWVWRNRLPCAQLVYCDDVADVVAMARPIGRLLVRHGLPLVLIDADGPVPGLPGRFVAGTMVKYYKGARRPRLGDLAYTEAGMFGFGNEV